MGTTATPGGISPWRWVRKISEGSCTVVSPRSPISKMPISSTEPKRFLSARRIRTSMVPVSK